MTGLFPECYMKEKNTDNIFINNKLLININNKSKSINKF